MGEQVILVCDVCGEPAVQSVSIRTDRRTLVKDLCDTHLAELTAGARPARRGRRRAAVKLAGARKRAPRRRKPAPQPEQPAAT
jgi:hypothetical protein